jgi:sporulation protein YlmC with PRC-barrel domain
MLHRRQNFGVFLVLSGFTALTSVASAQHHNESVPQHDIRIADRMSEAHASLSDAIAAAEKHCGGTAIGVVVTTSSYAMLPDEPRSALHGQTPAISTTSSSSKSAMNKATKSGAPDTKGGATSHNRLQAIVTCVVNDSMIRDCVVDLEDNTVVAVRSSASSRSYYGQQVSYDSQGEPRSSVLVRATDLMNADVRSTSDGRLGDIDDLALDMESNRAVYGVLRRGGLLGFGESRYAIPVDELAGMENRRITLHLSDADFEGYDGFDNSTWPLVADEGWDTNWTPVSTSSTLVAEQIHKASDLIGHTLTTIDGKPLGKLTDFILESTTGSIRYAVVDTERGSLAVPVILLQARDNSCTVQMTEKELLKQPAFDVEHEPAWNDARWNRLNNKSYGVDMNQTWFVTSSRSSSP